MAQENSQLRVGSVHWQLVVLVASGVLVAEEERKGEHRHLYVVECFSLDLRGPRSPATVSLSWTQHHRVASAAAALAMEDVAQAVADQACCMLKIGSNPFQVYRIRSPR